MYADSLSSCFREPTHEPTWFQRRETDFRRDRRLALVNPRGRTGSRVAVCFPFGIRLVVDRSGLSGSVPDGPVSNLGCGLVPGAVGAGAFVPRVRAARTVRPGATWRVYAVAGLLQPVWRRKVAVMPLGGSVACRGRRSQAVHGSLDPSCTCLHSLPIAHSARVAPPSSRCARGTPMRNVT